MRFNAISVSNFKAIKYLELQNLGDCVVIAGPNGCGKSCVLDAIRLLKSVYGGYQQNEWQSWFGEFQIAYNQNPEAVLPLLQDPKRTLEIQAQISISASEKAYLETNARRLLTDQAWKEIAPETFNWRYRGMTPIASHLRVHEQQVKDNAEQALPGFLAEVGMPALTATLTVEPSGTVKASESRAVETLFSTYDPTNIGIIDYHGAHRQYNREQFGGINLNLNSSEQQLAQHALYGYSNKYANLKQEMASTYVKHLLARAAGGTSELNDRLTATLKELFNTFFPGKEFLGPSPTSEGTIEFLVKTASGATHDIDDLSAGEKEVLYGYLRMRNSAPKNSVLLIDEPELHLNPRLISGLASFYRRHLAQENGTQLWLVTHSDTLIREAVGQDGYRVFHMQAPNGRGDSNQATLLTATRQIDQLIIDLVGDLAAYRPGAKVVLFEGGGDTEFDVRMTCALFPEFQSAVNAISAGDKRRVRHLHEVLEKARESGALPGMFFSITDRDSDELERDLPKWRFQWDAYHIENYLLETKHIRRVVEDITPGSNPKSDKEIEDQLETAAWTVLDTLIAERMQRHARTILLSCLDVGFCPSSKEPTNLLAQAVSRAEQRIRSAVQDSLSIDILEALRNNIRNELEGSLQDGSWRRVLPGRMVLKAFGHQFVRTVRYEVFRDLVIARMRDDGFKPPGMKLVVDRIIDAQWSFND